MERQKRKTLLLVLLLLLLSISMPLVYLAKQFGRPDLRSVETKEGWWLEHHPDNGTGGFVANPMEKEKRLDSDTAGAPSGAIETSPWSIDLSRGRKPVGDPIGGRPIEMIAVTRINYLRAAEPSSGRLLEDATDSGTWMEIVCDVVNSSAPPTEVELEFLRQDGAFTRRRFVRDPSWDNEFLYFYVIPSATAMLPGAGVSESRPPLQRIVIGAAWNAGNLTTTIGTPRRSGIVPNTDTLKEIDGLRRLSETPFEDMGSEPPTQIVATAEIDSTSFVKKRAEQGVDDRATAAVDSES